MRLRNSRVRLKVTALLLSLVALWGFAAWVTLRDGLNLLSLSTLDTNTGRPGSDLITSLQNERRATLVYLGRPNPQQRAALDAQRARTDKTVKRFRELASGDNVKRASSDVGWKRITETLDQLDTLEHGRSAIDAGTDRAQAAQPYNALIDSTFRVFRASAGLNEDDIARDSATLIDLTRAREVLSREDALLAGALAAGRLTGAEAVEFTRLVGAQRFFFDEAVAELPDSDRAGYERYLASEEYQRFAYLEDQVIQKSRTAAKPPISAADWKSAVEPVMEGHDKLVLEGGDRIVERAAPVATGVIIRLALAGGLGLLAVIASIIVSITTARALVRQLERLRAAAWELAEQRLPSVVERLGHGEKVDVAAEAPELRFGDDEIGQVGKAFNQVQRTALATAVEQAELRRGIRDVLLSLARRTQTLVHRQLTMLDTMERRRDIEVKELEELFRLDHLATRMRRNAENLIVLSGALPARGWRNSVPMVDVVRAAVGEVEDYTRVTVLPFGPVELAGRAVGDVTHLLAELIENAVSFSPPDTVVQVGGHLVASGFAIDIEDRGLGMTDDKLAEINERIADPPDFNLQSSVQLGLFVVSKLAERYNVQVSLKRSAYGGTTAVVVIPRDLIAEPSSAPVEAGATTRNGLEVRRPAAAGASAAGRPAAQGADRQAAGTRSSGATATLSPSSTGPQSTGPALVAVPPPASEPDGGDAPDGGAADRARSQEGAAPEDGGESATTEPEDQPPVPDISTTPSGLPVRVPQANLAEPLRAGESTAEEQEEEEVADPGRSPEEIQRIMGSYQRGTRQGRSAAAQAERQERRENAAEGEEDQ
ncbi:nitrate- and nitrite sensing domain-containing protein [Actinomadura sp. 6K520]|uniref:sensor histidine kinase n=1 Tax=Actinomadura sp. 6K520 TaxID=2530364 RepID=UPI001053EF61|nr:nitrate- and nitrite sensing domain-containing protein [Actinomadura sp. 6K520]TDE34561.1 HAMP domain-containing protein [Actinomadura sp. 6K520]